MLCGPEEMLTSTRTKGMTLEDLSVLFGDPVELSFEQALHAELDRGEGKILDILETEEHHVAGAAVEDVDMNASFHRSA